MAAFHTLSGKIHEGMRTQEDTVFPLDRSSSVFAFPLQLINLDIVLLSKNFQRHKAAVMEGGCIFFSRISQAYDQPHIFT